MLSAWQAVGRGLAAGVSRVGTMLRKRERVLPRHPVARCRQIIRAWAFGFSGNIIRLLHEALHHRQHRKSVDAWLQLSEATLEKNVACASLSQASS